MSQQDLFKMSQEPRRGKNGPREWYMNFGGWFAHPQEDVDVFVRLPKWRQREILATQRAFRDPTLVAYVAPEGLYARHEGPPASIKYDVADDIPFYAAKKFGGRNIRSEAEKLSPQERKELGYLF